MACTSKAVYGVFWLYKSRLYKTPKVVLRRKEHLHHHRQMVGHTAGVAGAGIGAEGFYAGVDVVAGKEEGDTEDVHSRGQRKRNGRGRWNIDVMCKARGLR